MLPKLGIIAGSGRLPALIIQSCIETSREYLVIALKGQASAELVKNKPHVWVRPGAVGEALKALRRAGAKQIVLAGGVKRPNILNVFPDFWTARFIFRTGALNFGDDGLLSALINTFETDEGLKVIGADELLPHFLATEGVYGAIKPKPEHLEDIKIGMNAAFSLGEQDLGQAVIVNNGKIIGREDKRGTDALIRSIGLSHKATGGILVKMKKPDQERRADLPAIGPNTIIEAARTGLSGIALEASSAFILDREEVVKKADEVGIFIIGTKAGAI